MKRKEEQPERTVDREFRLFLGIREMNLNGGTLAGGTFQMNVRMVLMCGVLDDRKPQPGAAAFLGVAFVHAVEPLKDPALCF